MYETVTENFHAVHAHYINILNDYFHSLQKILVILAD